VVWEGEDILGQGNVIKNGRWGGEREREKCGCVEGIGLVETGRVEEVES
jgi:hypothetical protein